MDICITYLLTPWNRVLLEKLTGSQLIKKFSSIYGTWRFITAFTRAHYLSKSICPGPRLSVWTFHNKIHFYGEELLAPHQTPELDDQPLLAINECLFSMVPYYFSFKLSLFFVLPKNTHLMYRQHQQTPPGWPCKYFLLHSLTHSLVFSLRGRAGRNQTPVMWPVWLWHTASWASSWG